jgi:hypothetical protein
LFEQFDGCQFRRNKKETAMSGTCDVSDESNLIAEPKAAHDELAEVPSSERNDGNDYAAYWRARSGLLIPVPENDHSLHSPSGE